MHDAIIDAAYCLANLIGLNAQDVQFLPAGHLPVEALG